MEMFYKGTGVRKYELAAIFQDNIEYREDILYVLDKQGKDSKSRNVQVLVEFYNYIDKYIRLSSNEPIFKKIPRNLDIHSYRAEFVCAYIRS